MKASTSEFSLGVSGLMKGIAAATNRSRKAINGITIKDDEFTLNELICEFIQKSYIAI